MKFNIRRLILTRRRLVSCLVVLSALAGLVWLASRPQPTGSAEETTIEGQAAATGGARDSFRVAVFSIHGCTPSPTADSPSKKLA